jgi:hypothetical protein
MSMLRVGQVAEESGCSVKYPIKSNSMEGYQGHSVTSRRGHSDIRG